MSFLDRLRQNLPSILGGPIGALYQNRQAIGDFANRIGQGAGKVTRTAIRPITPRTAYAPIQTSQEYGPIVERPNLRNQLINRTAQQYQYTPTGRNILNQAPIYFAPTYKGDVGGYYSPFSRVPDKQMGIGGMVLMNSGIDPETLTHEFTHYSNMTPHNLSSFNNKLNFFPHGSSLPNHIAAYWANRRKDWGPSLEDPYRNWNEAQSVIGTEIPERTLPQDWRDYYAPLYRAGRR